MDFTETLKRLIQEESPKRPLSAKEREVIYHAAFGMYNVGNYEMAANLFTRLAMYNPYATRFWQGLAASRQMQNLYKEALHAWGVFALLSNHIPEGHFHAAECYLSIGDVKEAKKALACASIHLNGSHPLAKKIEFLKSQVDEEIDGKTDRKN